MLLRSFMPVLVLIRMKRRDGWWVIFRSDIGLSSHIDTASYL